MDVQDLVVHLHSDDLTTQRSAVIELTELRAKSAITEVTPLLASQDPSLRSLVATFLGEVADLGDSNSGERLILLLDDDDELVRSNAALALGLLRYRQAIPALKKRVENDKEWLVRVQALEGLDYFKDATLFPFFQHILESDDDETVKRHVADSIYNIAEAENIGVIEQDIEQYKELPQVAAVLILALYRLGVVGSLDQFLHLLRSMSDEDTAFYCLQCLSRAIEGKVPPHMIADFPRIAVALDDLTQRFPNTDAYRDELKEQFQQIAAGGIIPLDQCC